MLLHHLQQLRLLVSRQAEVDFGHALHSGSGVRVRVREGRRHRGWAAGESCKRGESWGHKEGGAPAAPSPPRSATQAVCRRGCAGCATRTTESSRSEAGLQFASCTMSDLVRLKGCGSGGADSTRDGCALLVRCVGSARGRAARKRPCGRFWHVVRPAAAAAAERAPARQPARPACPPHLDGADKGQQLLAAPRWAATRQQQLSVCLQGMRGDGEVGRTAKDSQAKNEG